MKTRFLRLYLWLLVLLGGSFTVRGQGVDVDGPITVCSGSAYSYFFDELDPLNYIDSVAVEVTQGIIAMEIPPNQKRILWGAPGTGKVLFYGFGPAPGRPRMARDSVVVTILPLPVPTITTDTRVACGPIDEPGEGNDPEDFDDTACQKACANAQVTYDANSSLSSTYEWIVTGGTFVGSNTGPTCTVQWGAPGPGKLVVKEETADGCIGENSICIDIIESPLAHFVALPDTSTRNLQLCLGTEVIFLDKSTYSLASPIVGWRWDFGDGTYSNEKGSLSAPVTHKYNVAGSFTASLTVTNECGCSTTETIDIDVHPDPGVEIVCPGVVCENAVYDYTVDASCTGGNWQVIGGSVLTSTSTYQQVSWDQVDASGFGYLIYDPAGCAGYCPYPVAKKIPVVLNTGTIIGPDYLCKDKQYLYTLPQWPTTKFNWSVTGSVSVTLSSTGQPNEIAVTPTTNGGSFTLTCNYDNTLLGCSGSASITVDVPGQVTLSGPKAMCEGMEAQYTLTGPNSSTGQWTLIRPDYVIENGSGSNFYTILDIPGTYLLSVVGNFCPPEAYEIRVVPKPPDPNKIWGPDRICRGVPTQYVADEIRPEYIFNWSVTNGRVNIEAGDISEIILDPTSTGPFVVSVIRETKEVPHCQSNPITKTILLPNPIFFIQGRDTVCPSEKAGYYINYPPAEEYEWSIYPLEMGSIDQGQSTPTVSVLWNNTPGNAKLVCRVRQCFGPDNYYYDTLDVNVRSLAVTLTAPDTLCLYDISSMSVSNSLGGVTWNTGESVLHTEQDLTSIPLSYRQPITNYKTYHVIVDVLRPFGCSSPARVETDIVVTPAPWIYISPLGLDALPCGTTSINQLVTLSYDTNGIAPTSYEWKFGGSTVSTTDQHTVTTEGTYNVTVNSAFGCIGHPDVVVDIDSCYTHDPSGSGPPPTGCAPGGVGIEVVSVDCGIIKLKGGYANNSYFVDSSNKWRAFPYVDSLEMIASTDTTATFKALKAGTYIFGYQATYWHPPGPCTYEVDTTIIIPFVADIDIQQLCDTDINGKRMIRLLDNSTSLVPITYKEFWVNNNQVYVGNDRSFLTSVSPSMVRQTFWVGLEAGGGPPTCKDTIKDFVRPFPKVDFIPSRDTVCEEIAEIHFNNTTFPNASNFINLWDFGDGSGNDTTHPWKNYQMPFTGNSWPVTLKVTDNWGCADSLTKPVSVIPNGLEGDLSITPPHPCEHESATVTYTNNPGSTLAGHIPFEYEWYNAIGRIATNTSNTIPVFKSGYFYTQVTDAPYGCFYTTRPDTVLFSKAPRAFIYGPSDPCENVDFTLNGYVGQIPGVLYTWIRNGAVISGATTADLTDNQAAGTVNYQVIVAAPNPGGGYCSDTSDLFVVTVHPTPAPPTVTFSVLDCDDYTIELEVNPTYTGTYNWSNGMSGSTVQVKYGGPYQVTYTDPAGCISKKKIQTPRDLREYLWIFPTGCYSLCDTNANEITGPIIPFVRWAYYHNGSSFLTTTGYFYDVSLNPTLDGTYNMYLENADCSILSGDMVVDYDCRPGGPGGDGCEGCKTSTGVKELVTPLPTLQLAPNPAGSETRISYSYGGNKPCMLEVYDALGRPVFGTQLADNQGSVLVNLAEFVPGIYRVVLRQDAGILKHATLSVHH